MLDIPRPQNRLEQPAPLLRPLSGPCPIWKGKGTDPVGFWLLGKRLSWYGVHWIDGRAVPCLKSIGCCLPCTQAWLPRLIGYISAMRGDTGGRWLLRISDYAYRHCPALAIIGANYRGTPVIIKRLADRKQAPWVVDVPAVSKIPTLPPAVDVASVLSLVWGIDLNRLAECPPPDGDATKMLNPYRSKDRRRQ